MKERRGKKERGEGERKEGKEERRLMDQADHTPYCFYSAASINTDGSFMEPQNEFQPKQISD